MHDSSIKRPVKQICWLLAVVLLVGCFSGCGQGKTSSDNLSDVSEKKLNIMTTIYPLFEFSSKITGDRASVVQLLPVGSEPHHWEPSPADMKQVYDAQVFIYHGANMEPWVDKILPELQKRNIKIIRATEKVELLTFEEEESLGLTKFLGSKRASGHDNHGGHGSFDPHVWLDPLQAKIMVSFIAEKIAEADTVNADYYRQNAQEVLGELDQIHQEYSAAVSGFKNRNFVVSHAAFGYLAHRYELCQIPILGLTPEQEPDAATMASVIDFVRQQNIDSIFYEALVSPRVSEAIAKETGIETLELHPIGAITEEEREDSIDYFDLMRQNLINLKKALE
jgi:zinc transport system substrate-binding protein